MIRNPATLVELTSKYIAKNFRSVFRDDVVRIRNEIRTERSNWPKTEGERDSMPNLPTTDINNSSPQPNNSLSWSVPSHICELLLHSLSKSQVLRDDVALLLLHPEITRLSLAKSSITNVTLKRVCTFNYSQ